MTDAPATPQRERLSLDAQLDKLRRVLARQAAEYRRLHAAGHMTLEKRIESEAQLEDLWASFKWNVANAGWIKAEAIRRAFVAEQQRQLAELEGDIKSEFPGAHVINDTAHAQPEDAPA